MFSYTNGFNKFGTLILMPLWSQDWVDVELRLARVRFLIRQYQSPRGAASAGVRQTTPIQQVDMHDTRPQSDGAATTHDHEPVHLTWRTKCLSVPCTARTLYAITGISFDSWWRGWGEGASERHSDWRSPKRQRAKSKTDRACNRWGPFKATWSGHVFLSSRKVRLLDAMNPVGL